MKTRDVIEYFGTQAATARALGISTAAVAQWGESVPPLRQWHIEVLTEGKFKAQRPESSAAA